MVVSIDGTCQVRAYIRKYGSVTSDLETSKSNLKIELFSVCFVCY